MNEKIILKMESYEEKEIKWLIDKPRGLFLTRRRQEPTPINRFLAGGAYHYYLTDHQGNNRVVMTASNSMEQRIHYYPFGMAFAETPAAEQKLQAYKYNDKELDMMSGLNLYDYGARYFDPAFGRFITMDPLCEKYYSVSPYAYCGNNPVNRVDPTGMDWYNSSDHDNIVQFALMENDLIRVLSSTFVTPGGTIIEHRDDKDPTIYIVPDPSKWDGTKNNLEVYGWEEIGTNYNEHIGENIKDVGYYVIEPTFYKDRPLENVYPEFAIIGAGTKSGWALLKWLINQLISPVMSTTNTFNANAGFQVNGNKEKMGKAKGDMSANHTIQNKEAERIAKDLGITDKNKIRQIHDLISRQGYGYPEALKEVKAFFSK